MPAAPFLAFMAGAASARGHGGTSMGEEEKDIWKDVAVLHFLQTHKYGSGLSAKERDRIY